MHVENGKRLYFPTQGSIDLPIFLVNTTCRLLMLFVASVSQNNNRALR
jgi:hypothetical protein